MNGKVKFILEVPVCEIENNYDCDITGIKISTEEETQILKEFLPSVNKPLMIRASDDIAEKVLPELMKTAKKECIFGIVNENNYKTIVPAAIEYGHTVIIRTPIDINLAKEMNILTGDMGLEKILIDTDIGGLGYGFEYGYSIMEKIKLESKNDKYLAKPIISFAAEETSKTKEAKDENLALYLEITSASAVIAAGADYVVLNYPEALKTLRRLV